MPRRITLFVFASILPLHAKAGEVVTVQWLGAAIDYDRNHWLVSRPAGDDDLLFTCIASGCDGRPSVHASARELRPMNAANLEPFCPGDADNAGDRRRPLPVGPTPRGHIAFAA